MASRPTIYLVVEDASNVAIEELVEGTNVIGRSPKVRISLAGNDVTPRHAALIVETAGEHLILKLVHLAEGTATLLMRAGQFIMLQNTGAIREVARRSNIFALANINSFPSSI